MNKLILGGLALVGFYVVYDDEKEKVTAPDSSSKIIKKDLTPKKKESIKETNETCNNHANNLGDSDTDGEQ